MMLYRTALIVIALVCCHGVSGFTNSLPRPESSSAASSSSSTELTAVSPEVFLAGSALSVGAMLALNQNPDVLDSVISKSNSMSTPLPSAKKSSSPAKAKVTAATPEKLTKLVKTVADDLEKSKPVEVKKKKTPAAKKPKPAVAAVALDSIFTEPVSDRVRQPVKKNPAFFRKLTKKTVMPWREWSNL